MTTPRSVKIANSTTMIAGMSGVNGEPREKDHQHIILSAEEVGAKEAEEHFKKQIVEYSPQVSTFIFIWYTISCVQAGLTK